MRSFRKSASGAVGKTIMPPVSNSQLAKPGPGCCVDRGEKDFLEVENENRTDEPP
jgi:hypothetical protein